VEKSVDYPEMLIVTYEGPHLHGPQQPPFPRRQHWPSANLLSGAHANGQRACDGAEAPGGGNVAVAGDLRRGHRQESSRADDVVTATRSCDDGGTSASVASLPCDSPPATTWSCPDFYCSSWSPEALLP
jgi:hypothetical protein